MILQINSFIQNKNNLYVRARHLLRVRLCLPRVPRLRQGANIQKGNILNEVSNGVSQVD